MISGWKFTNILINPRITRKDEFLATICEIGNSLLLQQESYYRLSSVTEISDDTYVDSNNIINLVSIRHCSVLTCI